MTGLVALLAQIGRPPRSHRIRGRTVLAGSGRYLALGALAVAMFALMQLRPSNPLAATALVLLRRGGVVAIFAAAFAALLLRTQRLRGLVLQNNEGIFLGASGRFEEASALYERLARGVRGSNPYHALFVGNCGVSACLLGDFERGRPLLAEAIRSGWFDAPRPTAPAGYFAAWLARTFALERQLEKARAWREVASELLPPGRRAMLLAPDAILLLHSGLAGRAADAIAGAWMGAEGELPAHERRVLRALHAFALGLAGRTAELEPSLAALWPPLPGSLVHLRSRWPELAAFLEGRGVA